MEGFLLTAFVVLVVIGAAIAAWNKNFGQPNNVRRIRKSLEEKNGR